MDFRFVTGGAHRTQTDLLILPVFEGDLHSRKGRPEALAEADDALDGLLLSAAAEEGFKAKPDSTWTFHTHQKLRAKRVILAGLGARDRFAPEHLRQSVGRAIRGAAKVKAANVTLALPASRDVEAVVRAAVEGLLLGSYRFDRYRTRGNDKPAAPAKVALVLPPNVARTAAHDRAVELGRWIAQATNWARDLVNEPGGVMHPGELAAQARRMAHKAGLAIEVRGRKEIEKLRMGMFLGVAQGSAHEPKLVHLRWVPKDPKHARKPPVVLVGKAITFDSGGLSLKTAEGMVDMKTDMAGSAAVLGAMQVIAALEPPFPVHGLLGACENMPSGTAYRPGDVLVSRLGKTVEITNTDAEGRLVLGDVLTYAAELEPAAIVDLATLTGACMVALGHHVTGAFGDDDALVYAVLEAARGAGEELWRMPIHEAQKDALRSEVADLKNSGERYGAAINAAHFLKEFVGEVPWVHLDIAGPSQAPKEKGYLTKGATGVGVRTLVEFVRRRAGA